MTAEQDIDYDALAQEAMRGVVRAVLTRVQKSGLPGNHHFYIAFDTRHPGVVLSKRLKAKYAEEMTIVLQHRFWELIVTDARFEVKLTFDGIPERLVIPFAAIKVFFDPSVPYGLQFDEAGAARSGSGSVVGLNEDTGIGGQISGIPGIARASQRPSVGDRKRPVRRTRSEKDDDGASLGEEIAESPTGHRIEPTQRPQAALIPVPTGTEGEMDITTSTEQQDQGGQDNVISLDRFRKKP
ncbi:MAG TPA: ClpXP protease specificity-enhancing factor SspB [Hyphomicrobiaceae bacterium]|nr:ClpXP protease specificity-enhancing factor SspB [Hyphomicrobiaceae bacterium]